MTKEERERQLRRRLGSAVLLCTGILFVAPVQQPDKPSGEPGLAAGAMQEILREINALAEIQPEEVDARDLELMARLIHAEAGNQSDECLYYVGSVVLNRVSDRDFPDTIEEVIYQMEPVQQYACITDGNFDKEPDGRCVEIAEDLLHSGSIIPEDVVYQAEFEQGSGIWKQINNIIFCYK